MDIKISVITPTIGRPTLERALTSAQIWPEDEWLVIGDGPQPEAARLVKKLNRRRLKGAAGGGWYSYTELIPPGGNAGNAARDLGMTMARGDYLLFLDDDDIFVPHIWPVIKHELTLYTPRPVIFRMKNHTGEILWKTQTLAAGNIGGSMFCPPNVQGHLARWEVGNQTYQSDFWFISRTLAHYNKNDLAWSGEVIISCKGGEWK